MLVFRSLQFVVQSLKSRVQSNGLQANVKWVGCLCLLTSLITHHSQLQAQDVPRAHKVVDTLASPFFHGRGYVQYGDSLAAEYLASQFKSIGLTPISGSYFQSFPLAVNTFPSKLKLKVNGKIKIPGKDFILDAASIGRKGKFKVLTLDSSFLSSRSERDKRFPLNKKKWAVAYPADWERKMAQLPISIIKELQSFPVSIVYGKKKLTYTVSRTQDPRSGLELISSERIKKINLEVESAFVPRHVSRNVLGYVEGTTKKDSFLVLTAHYDHLGQMGGATYFPGANDNASGIATLLELARQYALPENRLPYSIVFIGFAAEEAGLIGSKYFVEHPLVPLASIKFLVNLDLMGSGKEGLTVVNGMVLPKQFGIIDSLNKANAWFSKLVPRGKSANSDHYFFSEKGVPAIFMYTMGEITAYHDVDDTPQVVTFSKLREVVSLINAFFHQLSH